LLKRIKWNWYTSKKWKVVKRVIICYMLI
jgi:hypothetical protein